MLELLKKLLLLFGAGTLLAVLSNAFLKPPAATSVDGSGSATSGDANTTIQLALINVNVQKN